MTKAEIYRKAAKQVANGDDYQMCYAIDDAAGNNEEADSVFTPIFSPRQGMGNSESWGREFSADLPERKRCRVLALCFAAAMAEAGDL